MARYVFEVQNALLLSACLLEITRLDKAELAHVEMPAQSGQNLIGSQGFDLFLEVDVEGHRPVRMKLQPEAAHQFRILGPADLLRLDPAFLGARDFLGWEASLQSASKLFLHGRLDLRSVLRSGDCENDEVGGIVAGYCCQRRSDTVAEPIFTANPVV